MRGEIIGYNATTGQITIELRTIKDGDNIPLGKEIEINTAPKERKEERTWKYQLRKQLRL